MSENQFVLSSLSEEAYKIQDNSLTDEWGVVLRQNLLPDSFQDATCYTITIDGKTYDLTKNVFDSNIYNGGVSNIDHTQDQVRTGIVKKK